jgi:hypothetical protein
MNDTNGQGSDTYINSMSREFSWSYLPQKYRKPDLTTPPSYCPSVMMNTNVASVVISAHWIYMVLPPSIPLPLPFRRTSRPPHSTRLWRLARVFLTLLLIVTALCFLGRVPLPDADENPLVGYFVVREAMSFPSSSFCHVFWLPHTALPSLLSSCFSKTSWLHAR